jgi:hypothetical protein
MVNVIACIAVAIAVVAIIVSIKVIN